MKAPTRMLPSRSTGGVHIDLDQVLLALWPACFWAMTSDPTPSIMTNRAAKMKYTLTR